MSQFFTHPTARHLKTLFRWIVRLLVAVVIIIVAIPVVATLVIDKDDVRTQVDQFVFERTGRHLNINGPLGFTPGLKLGVYAEDIHYENAPWASGASAASIQRLSAKISLLEALGGVVRVDEVRIEGFDMSIEFDDTGQINLVNPSDKPSGKPGPIPLPDWLEIRSARVLDSRILSLAGATDFEIALDRVELNARDRAAPLEVDGNVRLQKTPFTARGTLGTLESWLGRTPSAADLVIGVANSGETIATGTVGDVLAWSNIDVDLDGTLESLSAMKPLVPEIPVAITNIQVSGRIEQSGVPTTMTLRSLTGSLESAGVTFALQGEIDRLAIDQQFDIAVKGKGELDRSLLPDTFPEAVRPVITVDGSLGGNSKAPSLALGSLNVAIDGATAELSGAIDNLTGDWGDPMTLQVDLASLPDTGALFDADLPALGGVAGSAALLKKENGFALTNIDLKSRNSAAAAAVSGELNNLGPAMSGALSIVAAIQPEFFAASGIEIPVPLEPIDATATLQFTDGEMRLDLEEAATSLPGANLTARGAIPDLKQPTDMQINLSGNVADLSAVGTMFDQALPGIRNIDINGRLVGEGGTWHLQNLEASKEEDDGLALNASGELRDLGASMTAEIGFDTLVSVERIGSLVPESGDALKPIAGELADIKAEGRVVAASAKEWSLPKLEATTRWLGAKLDATGQIGAFAPLSGGFAVSLKGNPEGQSELLKDYPVPEIDNLDVSLEIELPIEENGIRNLRGEVVADTATLAFDGDIRQLSPLSGEGFNISLKADEAASLVPGNDTFAEGNPVDISVDIALDPGEISVAGKVQIGESDLDGSVSFLSGKDRKPAVRAVVHSSGLNFDSLLIEATPDSEDANPDRKEQKNRVFSDEKLLPAFTDKLDLDLKLEVAILQIKQLVLENLQGKIETRGGSMVADLAARSGEGGLEIDLDLEHGGDNQISATISALPLERVTGVANQRILLGGRADIDFDLRGNASSVAELLEKGEGGLKLDIRDSRMANKTLSAVGGDLFTNVLSAVNPFQEKRDTVGVQCIAMRLDIGDGKIKTEQGLAMKTDTVTLLGGGELTMPGEQIKIAIAPKARKGLGVSATSIAKMVRIGGTLSNPSVETDAKGLLKSGAAIGAALASGGLSLFAQGILDRFQANSDVCAIARGDKERPEAQTGVGLTAPK